MKKLILSAALLGLVGCISDSKPVDARGQQIQAPAPTATTPIRTTRGSLRQSSNPEISTMAWGCELGFDQGEVLNPSVLQGGVIAEGLFQKKYNRSWLEAVLRTSPQETLRAAQLEGVSVYRSDYQPIESCRLFQSLGRAPIEAQA